MEERVIPSAREAYGGGRDHTGHGKLPTVTSYMATVPAATRATLPSDGTGMTHPFRPIRRGLGHPGRHRALFSILTQAILETYTGHESFSFGFCVQVRRRRPHVLQMQVSTWSFKNSCTFACLYIVIAPFLFVFSSYCRPT